MDKDLADKREALVREIRELGSCVIAFSGGADSALLFAVAKDVLGDRVLAITAKSARCGDRPARLPHGRTE